MCFGMFMDNLSVCFEAQRVSDVISENLLEYFRYFDGFYRLSDSILERGYWMSPPESLSNPSILCIFLQHFVPERFITYCCPQAPANLLEFFPFLYESFIKNGVLDVTTEHFQNPSCMLMHCISFIPLTVMELQGQVATKLVRILPSICGIFGYLSYNSRKNGLVVALYIF